MLRTLYVILGGCLLSLSAFGQQDPQFSFFMFTPTYLNPAAVGSEGVTRVQLIHRSQWMGYQGASGAAAPTTQLLTATLPLAKINSGVGIYAFNDNIGPQSNQSLQLAYAYRLPLKNGTLGIGVQAGLYNKRIDYSGIILPDPNSGPDPLVPSGQVSQIQPDFSAGLYYSTVDYWLGASLFHINTPAYKLGTERGINPLAQTAYLSAGYKLGVTYAWDVQPSILYKYSQGGLVASSLDLNLLGTYDGRYSVGVSYRTGESITALAAANVLNNKARLGFAYDLVTFGQTAKRPGSLELLLSYVLPAPNSTPRPIVRTPRFRY